MKITACLISMMLYCCVFAPIAGANDAEAFFEARIRPVLAKHCYSCHSAEAAKAGTLQADLQLDTRAGTRLGGHGGAVLQPGNPEASELWLRMRSGDLDEVMPPEHRLSAGVIDDFRRWIREGAFDPRDGQAVDPAKIRLRDGREHWAYQPLQRVQVPIVALPSEDWNHPIDRFVIRKHQALGLQASPAADEHTLIRRLFVDLTGMPPHPDQIQEFLSSTGPQAWQEWVDRVLADPRFGERWGRHWLDVARFGESDGNSDDNDILNKAAWKYRDAVIRATNADLPWSEFVRRQIAGKPAGSEDASMDALEMFLQIGTRLNDNSNPNDRKFHILNDMVSTIGQAFLATTIGCARCHDHKIDPFTSEEYYQLTAVVFDQAKVIPDAGGKHVPLKLKQAHLLSGGDWNAPVRAVEPSGLRVLMRSDESVSMRRWFRAERDPRHALVDWMIDTRHGAGALLARVIVNRIWHYHFGQGLVDTPNDFGKLGSSPTHPELLDWLAQHLIDHQWRLKPIHRLILTSATWRQGASPRGQQTRIDAENRYLWQQRPRRMEAESIRDSLLSVAGQLNANSFGPSIPVGGRKQPFKDTPATWRRSVYLMSPRMDLHPLLEVFDLPDNEFSTGKRDVSTTPAGALLMLNSPFVKQQAQYFAERLLRETQDKRAASLTHAAYQIALSRPPTEAETRLGVRFLGASEVSTETLAAYCHLLMTLNEFIYVN